MYTQTILPPARVAAPRPARPRACPSLDDLMPRWDTRMIQSIRVRASAGDVFRALEHLHTTDMPLATLLGRVRASLAPRQLDVIPPERPFFEAMQDVGWLVITRDEEHVVYGLIGRFWWRDFGIRFVDVDQYLRFAEPGYAKIAFALECRRTRRGLRLYAETRVATTSEDARLELLLYWSLVSVGARLTVRSMLKAIRRIAEASAAAERSVSPPAAARSSAR